MMELRGWAKCLFVLVFCCQIYLMVRLWQQATKTMKPVAADDGEREMITTDEGRDIDEAVEKKGLEQTSKRSQNTNGKKETNKGSQNTNTNNNTNKRSQYTNGKNKTRTRSQNTNTKNNTNKRSQNTNGQNRKRLNFWTKDSNESIMDRKFIDNLRNTNIILTANNSSLNSSMTAAHLIFNSNMTFNSNPTTAHLTFNSNMTFNSNSTAAHLTFNSNMTFNSNPTAAHFPFNSNMIAAHMILNSNMTFNSNPTAAHLTFNSNMTFNSNPTAAHLTFNSSMTFNSNPTAAHFPLNSSIPWETLPYINSLQKVMYNRGQYLREQCGKLDLTEGRLWPPLARIADYTNKGLFHLCVAEKSGTSSWKWFGKELRGGREVEELRGGRDIDEGDMVGVLSVRHPFTRLASAYRDKYLNGEPISNYQGHFKRFLNNRDYWDLRWKRHWLPALISGGRVNPSPLMSLYTPRRKPSLIPAIEEVEVRVEMAYWRRMEELKTKFANVSFTFEEFLNHVVWTHEVGLQDVCWTSVYAICQPCQRYYDYVVRLETAADEVPVLFEAIHYPYSVSLPVKHRKKEDLLPDRLMYKNIPKDLLDKIRKLFWFDFELFQYSQDVDKII